MRYAFYRLTAPILDRIPDISHQPKGRQMSIGLAASLLFHLLMLLLALLFGLILPKQSLLEFAKPKPKLEEIEVTIVPPEPEAELTPLTEPLKPVLASAGLAASEKPPEDAVFQSGVNMKAASETPGTGEVPLPNQKGRVEPDAVAFANPAEKTSAPMTPPAEPPAEEVSKPPTELKEVPKPGEDQIALVAKSATPAPAEPKPRFRNTPSARELAMLTPPAAPDRPSPEQLPTEIDGSIRNRGKAAASSAATPLGKYLDQMTMLVDSRWKHYVRNPSGGVGFPTGSVRVTFSIDRRGRISVVRSSDNTSNNAFALVSERALTETELPTPPPGLFDDLPGRKFTHTFKFTLH